MKPIRRGLLTVMALWVAIFLIAQEGRSDAGAAAFDEKSPEVSLSRYLAALGNVDLAAAAEVSAAFPDEDERQAQARLDSDMRSVQGGIKIPEGEVTKVIGDCAIIIVRNLGPGVPVQEACLIQQGGEWKVLGLRGASRVSKLLTPAQKQRFDGFRTWTRTTNLRVHNEATIAKLEAQIDADPGGKRGQEAAAKKRFAEMLMAADPYVWLDFDSPDGFDRMVMEFDSKGGALVRAAAAEMRSAMAETRASLADGFADLAESMVEIYGDKQKAVAEAERKVAEAERAVAEAEMKVREALENVEEVRNEAGGGGGR